jgi:hypothetical protein
MEHEKFGRERLGAGLADFCRHARLSTFSFSLSI